MTVWLLLTQRRHFTVVSNKKRIFFLRIHMVYAVDDEKINRALENDLRPREEMYNA